MVSDTWVPQTNWSTHHNHQKSANLSRESSSQYIGRSHGKFQFYEELLIDPNSKCFFTANKKGSSTNIFYDYI